MDGILKPNEVQARLHKNGNEFSFDAGEWKSLTANSAFLEEQRKRNNKRFSINLDAEEYRKFNHEVIDSILTPWSLGQMDLVRKGINKQIGNFFEEAGPRRKYAAQMNKAEEKLAECEAALAGNPKDAKYLAMKREYKEFMASLIMKPIPNSDEEYYPMYDQVLDSKTITLDQIKRGEPIRYQHPIDGKNEMWFTIDPNGELGAVQLKTEKEAITEKWIATPKKQMLFDDILADEFGILNEVKSKMKVYLDQTLDWELESLRQGTIPNGTRYNGHASHTITTDLAGTSITKLTPSALIKLIGMLNHYPTVNTLVAKTDIVGGSTIYHKCSDVIVFAAVRALQEMATAGTTYWSPAKSDQLLINGINGNFIMSNTPVFMNQLFDDNTVRAWGGKGKNGVFVNVTGISGSGGGSYVVVDNTQKAGTPFEIVEVSGWKCYSMALFNPYHQAAMTITRG